MPKRKKTRTHVKQAQNKSGAPACFVIRSGKVSRGVMELVRNFRNVMEPNTASRLKERNNNKLKDYVAMAGPLGVSHFAIFSKAERGTTLRICKSPRGPTLSFRVKDYALIKEIAALQLHPRSPGQEYQHAPLLVLNNFNREGNHFKLMITMFQNMFPALNIQRMHITDCRRVVLLHYDPETDLIDFRHYYINVKTVGVSKSIKRIIQTDIPNLNKYDDIADYILRDAALSESEMEDNGESVVTLAGNYVGRNNKDSTQRAVRLVEIGPRLELELMKIQEGLCEGEVLYHKYIQRTEEEKKSIEAERQRKTQLKAERKKRQEENVARKKAEIEQHKLRCIDPKQLDNKREREKARLRAAEMENGGSGSEDEREEREDFDHDEAESEYSDDGVEAFSDDDEE